MRRNIWKGLVLLLLCAALLTACGGKKARLITGLVTELHTGEDGSLTAFVIQTESGEDIGVLLSEETLAYPAENGSWTSEDLRAAFQAALRPDVMIRAECARGKKKLTTDGGTSIPAYRAEFIHITGRLDRGAVTMEDGTPVDVMVESGTRIYRLADGTELLRVRPLVSPENSYTLGTDGLDTLNETARRQVLAYYDQRGLLYDERAELEKVYALYRESGTGFVSGWVDQSVSPAACNHRLIYLLTTVTLPTGEESGHLVYETRLSDAFDRETGAHIDTWELFTAPKDVVVKALLDAGGVEDPTLRAEMETIPWDGRITIDTDSLSVWFEAGTLPSQPNSTGFWVGYDQGIRDLVQDWAIPESREQS